MPLLPKEQPILAEPAPETGQKNTIETPAPKPKKTYQDYKDVVEPPLKAEGYEAITFCPTSARFLTFFSSSVKAFREDQSLHPWQIETNEDISLGITRNYFTGEEISRHDATSIHPYRFALCAANGSGKDNFVIAPLALWFICSNIKAKVIITSSSATQLEIQTEKYIRELAQDVNTWALEQFGQEILRIKQRRITCLLSGSVIHLFATDEPAKAEGHHPLAPGAKMLIVVNEAKSITPDIYDALNRCTGFTHWLDVSSPGQPMGDFHYHFNTWPNKRRISYFDCPHHSPDLFEEDRMKYGEHSAHFRSKWLALFTFSGGKYVVPHQKLQELQMKQRNGQIKEMLQATPIRIGIDLSLSSTGDETVISVWRGNKQLDQKCLHQQDATILTYLITEFLLKYVRMDHEHIFADDGGVGRPIIDIMNRKGWQIKRVLNNTASRNKKLYKNRGAQLWYKFGRLIEEQLLIFHDLNDTKLFNQIASRKYKDATGGNDVLQLEQKKDMIAAGFPSPDRADAAVLAFTNVALEDFLGGREEAEAEATVVKKTKEELIAELKYNLRYRKDLVYGNGGGKQKHSNYSLSVILKNNQHASSRLS